MAAFLLNGALFVLVGVEVQSAVRGLTSVALARGLIAVGVVSTVVIGRGDAGAAGAAAAARAALGPAAPRHVRRAGHLAETLATEEALAAMPYVAADLGTDPEVVGRMVREYEKHLRVLRANGADADDEPALRHEQHYTALRLALLARKRATVVRLRDERRIDDIVLRQVQRRLDIEEVRLSRREVVD